MKNELCFSGWERVYGSASVIKVDESEPLLCLCHLPLHCRFWNCMRSAIFWFSCVCLQEEPRFKEYPSAWQEVDWTHRPYRDVLLSQVLFFHAERFLGSSPCVSQESAGALSCRDYRSALQNASCLSHIGIFNSCVKHWPHSASQSE